VRVLVCGSRGWIDREAIWKRLDALSPVPEHSITIMEGGAIGADRIAGQWAEHHGVAHHVFLPDYDRYGRRAPLERNNQMLSAEPDLVLAFDLGSRGTAHTIAGAKMRGIPVEVVAPARKEAR
jgi:hypothetical protein